MDEQTSQNPITPQQQTQQIEKAADRLADLLAETLTVRELVRAAQNLKDDPDVMRIARGIRDLNAAEGENKQPVMDRLLSEREALPAVQQFRQAEAAVRELFSAVDEIISSRAGMQFSENARANLNLLTR